MKAEEFLSHTVTVCDICYAVAIAEYHLMNVERLFAKAQGIPIKSQTNLNLSEPDIPPLKLYQWRVLFYFNYMIIPDKALDKDKEYSVQLKIFEHVNKFPFEYKTTILKLNKLRVHYFFSTSRDINAALENLLVDIKINEGDKTLFKGKSLSLQYFTSKYCRIESLLMNRCISLFSTNVSQHITSQVLIS